MPRDAAARDLTNPAGDDLRAGDPVQTLSGVGPKRAQALARIGIRTIADLLLHVPRAYEDRRHITPIADVVEGNEVTVIGTVRSTRLVRMRRRMTLAEAVVEDASGVIKATWFGRGYLARALTSGTRLVLTGTVGQYKGLALKNPEYEVLSGEDDDAPHLDRLVPIYPLTEGVTQRMLRAWIRSALDAVGEGITDIVPLPLRTRHDFPAARTAIPDIHFPDDLPSAERARQRFAYAELLTIQTQVLLERFALHASSGIVHPTDGPVLSGLRNALPFDLTPGQSQAVDALLADLAAPRPMARLLQGDVGCGKTVVALHAIAACVDGAHQAALMAPTEVLAAQHYRTLSEWLTPLGVQIVPLTGASPAATRRMVDSPAAQVIVGTHALFEDRTQFHRLGLVIVDEQHRFGVAQRDRLAAKAEAPDVLHMTATPIPRSLALTLYGAMDLTIVPDLPKGRRPVATSIVSRGDADPVWRHVAEQAHMGFQTYVICPLVESADNAKRADVTTRLRELTDGPLTDVQCAVLHGRLDSLQKQHLLDDFRKGDIQVLVSTTVVEVGVDAPRATVIVIEDADTFGLTQLHQLRGRVGRNGFDARCYLLTAAPTSDAGRRLQVLCETNDGFRIAEEDFRLRGPGEVHGARQAGLSDLRAADLIRDAALLIEARRDAEQWLLEDPGLRRPESAGLATATQRRGAILY